MTDIFKNKRPNFQKLMKFGFVRKNQVYTFNTPMNNAQFILSVEVQENGKVSSKITDIDFGEEYVLHLVPDATGEYIGKIRTEYNDILQKIAAECFDVEIFKTSQAKEIICYVRQKYGDEAEYLWPKFPNNAIWRRKDNKKWYGVILTVSAKKFGFESSENLEVIDIRADKANLANLIDNQKYFAGYHMNKEHWLTICLNNSVTTEEIMLRIDESYRLAAKK
ncbi:MAG: MmcQ/YjbR family DNA-binding protein [Alphaproteobacteria bacterium]|nr:MmcQ/YjbR family DNA-binding protein [Alphaproteobacteria bacterium]